MGRVLHQRRGGCAARSWTPRRLFDFDKLPREVYFLTSQTLRVVTEPPPPGTPETSPGAEFPQGLGRGLRHAKNTTIQADVITYDSLNDLIYARSLEGRPVQVVQQSAAGQPGSPTRAEAVRVNPKTGAADVIGPQPIQWLDAKTGTRPAKVAPPDPNAKAPAPQDPVSHATQQLRTEGLHGTVARDSVDQPSNPYQRRGGARILTWNAFKNFGGLMGGLKRGRSEFNLGGPVSQRSSSSKGIRSTSWPSSTRGSDWPGRYVSTRAYSPRPLATRGSLWTRMRRPGTSMTQ